MTTVGKILQTITIHNSYQDLMLNYLFLQFMLPLRNVLLLNVRVTSFFWSKLFYGRLWLNSLTAPKLFKATWVLLSFDRAPYDQKMIWKSAKSGSEDYSHFLCPSWANFNASIKVIKLQIVLKLKHLKKIHHFQSMPTFLAKNSAKIKNKEWVSTYP